MRSAEENLAARAELERRGLSFLPAGLSVRLGRWLGVERRSLGDPNKNWDVLATATFVEGRLPRDARIVDFGAYRSEIVGVLSRLGYAHVFALDLNPKMARGFRAPGVHYVVGDFHVTGFAPGTFDAVTAISAIEHGHSVDRLFTEVSRLLRPGGYLIASTDYWPDKVDTTGHPILRMDWTIFSAAELADLMDVARGHGLSPVGELDYRAGAPAIHYEGRHYTFAWLALRKEERRS